MNKKMVAIFAIVVSMLLMTPLAHSQEAFVRTDKAEYLPGETGTLHYSVYNSRSGAITLKKVTIIYSNWRAIRNGVWEGNQTIDLNVAIIGNGVYENSTTFTVPSDGRTSTSVSVTFETEPAGAIGTEFTTISVSITPNYLAQIIMWLMVLDLLVIVAIVIIAATIFLSARRPQVMWKSEEKP